MSPKRTAATASGESPVRAPRRAPGEPVPSSPRGVFIRAGIVSALFYPYLIFVAGETPALSLVIAVAALLLMIPLGLFLDRLRYNRQMRKYLEKKSARR